MNERDCDTMDFLEALSSDNQRVLMQVLGLTEEDRSPEEQMRRLQLSIDLRKARRRAKAN